MQKHDIENNGKKQLNHGPERTDEAAQIIDQVAEKTPNKVKPLAALLKGSNKSKGLTPGITAKNQADFAFKDPTALKIALGKLNIKVRYNLRSARPEFRTENQKIWSGSQDRKAAKLRDKIALNFRYETARGPMPLRYGLDAWDEALNVLLNDNEIDPFIDWLESVQPWDKIERIDEYLTDIFGISKTEISLWVSQFLFLGPIQRTFEPGCKLDEMAVFVGSQGIGKSALVRSILPPEFPEFFSDCLNLAGDAKTRVESLQGHVIVEASEMAGSTKAELESLKAFATAQDDGNVRLSYRRNPEPSPRRCIIVGTTDRDDCLPNDPAGLRRFVPIRLNAAQMAVEDYMNENRNQLWAESLHRYRKWIRASLPRKLTKDAAEAAQEFRNIDEILEEKIRNLILRHGTLEQIAREIGIDERQCIDMRVMKRISAALRNEGWKKAWAKNCGKTIKIWRSPQYIEA